MAEHEGVMLAALRDVTVVHDGVICNSSHALTAMAAKHAWHPTVHEMHGCRLPDDDALIRITGTALLLVRYMGWFWGHFCQDLLHRLAFAVEFLQEQHGEVGFKVIVESRTHASVLALIQAMLGGNANTRVLFMPSDCLRGMSCPAFFLPQNPPPVTFTLLKT